MALLASLGGYAQPPAVAAAISPFTDIAGSTFEADIEWLWAEGITVGCSPTAYCPDAPVTRGQMASFLVRMFDLVDGWDVDAFVDDDGTTHEQDINRLAHAGVTKGCTETTFCPGDPVRRDAMASFLVRAIPLLDGAGRNYFRDDNGTTHEADIDRLSAGGIASGCGVWRYCPAQSVTRGQMAGFLRRVEVPLTTEPPYPAPSGALTFHVAVDGDDTGNDCIVETSPCRTIAHALEITLDGDTIAIGPGTFFEEGLTVVTDITITGDPGGGTVIDASGGAPEGVMATVQGTTVRLDRLTLTGGETSDGGGIYNRGSLTISDSRITENRASFRGGGISTTGPLTVIGSVISLNGPVVPWVGFGGGVFVAEQATAIISDSIVKWNSGGAISSMGGDVTLSSSLIAGNRAFDSEDVGGIHMYGGSLAVRDSTIRGNSSSTGAGGIQGASNWGDAITISNSSITGNRSSYATGGIRSLYGSLLLANSTVAMNDGNSGGVESSGTVTVVNATVSANVARTSGNPAGIATYGGELHLANTINAGNIGPDIYGPITSQLASIVGVPAGLTPADILDPAGLADNGGPTQTIALTDSAENPAIDTGDAATCAADPVGGVDQRGEPRTPPCDIGAYEVQQ